MAAPHYPSVKENIMCVPRLASALALAGALASGCATMGGQESRATTTLEPTKDNTASGTVTFVQRGGSVHVVADIHGLKPNAEHGFHVHEKGDCSSGDGMSTGGHFNPAGKPHGPQSSEHHAGDMPSLTADTYGSASASFDLTGVSIGSGTADLVGKGLIV